MGEQADIVVLGAGMAGGCARPWRRLMRVRTCSSSGQPKPSGIYGAERWTRLGPKDFHTDREYIPKGDALPEETFCRELSGTWAWLEDLRRRLSWERSRVGGKDDARARTERAARRIRFDLGE
jgi:hypothetical protein